MAHLIRQAATPATVYLISKKVFPIGMLPAFQWGFYWEGGKNWAIGYSPA